MSLYGILGWTQQDLAYAYFFQATTRGSRLPHDGNVAFQLTSMTLSEGTILNKAAAM